MSARKPPRLLQSGLTGRVYVVTAYTEQDGGVIEARTKHDVTADFNALSAGLADRDRAVAEKVWEEGHDDGVTNMEQDSMIEAGLRRRLTNPYRKEPS